MTVSDIKYTGPLTDNCLQFNAAAFSRAYKAEYFIEDDINNKTRITHNAFIRTIEPVNQDVYLVSAVLWNFMINGQKPDLVLEQLAEKCRRPLENIIFFVNKNWQLVGIYNHENILRQWHEVREQLKEEYSGELFEAYIAQHEQVLYNAGALLEKLKKDIFLNQFFCGLYHKPFRNYTLQGSEQAVFMNIDYTMNTMFSLGMNDDSGDILVMKDIDRERHDVTLMPAPHYRVGYVLGKDLSIQGINGRFENYGRKFIFHIETDKSIGN